MSIEISNLRYEYNPKTPFKKVALNNVSLTIEDGEFFGIIGHTGSGKSTFVQHLNGLIKAQSGDIKVAGYDLRSKKTNFMELRTKIGMVFQYPEYQLFAETVEKDIAFGLKNYIASEKRRRKKEKLPLSEIMTDVEIKQAVKNAIEMVGLDYNEVKDKSPFDLSGGQKRRVAIAGVVVTKPQILVLDEPTAGLDPQGKKEILSLVHELKATCTPTIIMISHDMDEISEHATRIGVMANAELKYVMTPKQLFTMQAELEKMGLDVPTTIKACALLKNKGFKIDDNLISAKEFAEGVAKQLKKDRNTLIKELK